MLRRKGSGAEPYAGWTTLVPTAVTTASGAVATTAADGTIVVTGTGTGAGDTYTVTCPVPAGVEPWQVRIELPVDATQGGKTTGRGPGGTYAIAEVSIAAARGGRPPAMVVPLDVRSDAANDVWSRNRQTSSGRMLDGRPDTFWSLPPDKSHEAVFTIGLPSRTGGDAARWQYPLERVSAGPITSLVITILHANAAIGTFRISVPQEIPTVTKEATP